jgi:hypothetical protein
MSDGVRWAWRPQEGPQKALVDYAHVARHRRGDCQISQGPNGEVRVRLHDKHAALVSAGPAVAK